LSSVCPFPLLQDCYTAHSFSKYFFHYILRKHTDELAMHVDESCNDYSRRKGAEVILIALLLAITPQSSMQHREAAAKKIGRGKGKPHKTHNLSD